MGNAKISKRLKTIDGLRGIAALAVVFYHFSGELGPAFQVWVPDVLLTLFSFGFLGVPIFFVLSGFVIALSVGNSEVNAQYAGNFALRRAIRLDPTYWSAIAIALTLIFVKNAFLGENHPYPTWGNFFAHLFYLQDIFNYPNVISSVFWTLCIEFQFYLFFIFILWGSRFFFKNIPRYQERFRLVCFSCVGILSLIIEHGFLELTQPGLFIRYWHYFWAGVLAWRAYQSLWFGRTFFLSWLCLELIFQLNAPIRAYSLTGMAASTFIFIAGQKNALNGLFSGAALQYLGRISYTLYLLHADIGWKFISVCQRLFGEPLKPFMSALVFFMAIGVSVLAAHLLHIAVEKPTLRVAANLKKKRNF